MNATRHGDYLIQLTRWRMFNCFFVREDDGLTLIDTNLFGCADGILSAARDAGAPIVRILITHAHGDHVGSLDALHAALPDVPVMIGAREARLLRGDMTLDSGEPQDKLRGSFLRVQTQPTRELQPGERIGSLEVVASPGHTPGHLAYFDSRDGTLIAGDALATQAGLIIAGTFRVLFPFAYMATWHRPTALASARAMRALNPSRLAVGHGKTLANPLAALDRAIAETARAVEGG